MIPVWRKRPADSFPRRISSHYKSWRLTGLFVFCGLLYTVGFVFRCLGAWDYGDLIKYILSICLTFAAP